LRRHILVEGALVVKVGQKEAGGGGLRREIIVGLIAAVVGALAGAFAAPMAAGLVESRAPKLAVPDFTVATQSMIADGINEDGGRYSEKISRPIITTTIHNRGSRRAVVTRIRLVIEDSVFIPACEIGGGPFKISASYDAQLPLDAAPGAGVTIPVSQEIGADEVDKFSLVLGILGEPRVGPYLYRLNVVLIYDDGANLDVGRAIVSLPEDPEVRDFSGRGYSSATLEELKGAADASERGCYADAARKTASILRMPGARTPTLQDLTDVLA